MIVPHPEVYKGVSSLGVLSDLTLIEGQRVLLVSDSGLEAAGHVERAVGCVRDVAAGIATHLAVRPNPGPQDVARCLDAASECDVVLGLGGGSVMDVAKLAALLKDTGTPLSSHRGVGEAVRGRTGLILVPTSAGTGSEAQAAAILSDPLTRKKTAYLAPGLGADVVVLDPELTLTCPFEVKAASGLDALTHALEVAVTRVRSEVSDALAERAFASGLPALTRLLEAPMDLEASSDMLYAAHEAGSAIAHAMLGAAHAAGNALSARFGTTHGVAVAQMLPAVIAFNAHEAESAQRYMRLAKAAGLSASLEALRSCMEALFESSGLERAAIHEDDLEPLVDEAMSQWTGRFNPRMMDRDGFMWLFEEVR